MNKTEIDLYYPRLVVIHGEYCYLCTKTPKELDVEKLEIHEIKYERPLRLANMRLMCHGCNHLKELNKVNIDDNVEKAPEIYRTSKKRHIIFLDWISREMMNNVKKGINFNQLVADACLYTGMKRQTIINWLRTLYEGKTSPYTLEDDTLFIRGREFRGHVDELPERNKEFTDSELSELK